MDIRFVKDLSLDIAATIDGLGQAWYKLSNESIENIILTALKINFALNYRHQLVSDHRVVPSGDVISILQECIMVPRFVRDTIREIIRPMHHSGITYLPDIDLSTRSTPNLLDTFYDISKCLTRWRNACEKLGYELVPLLPEALMSVSLTFYSSETDEILSFDNIVQLDWRLEAFGRTRHLLYQPKSEEEEYVDPTPTALRKRVTKEVPLTPEEPRMYQRQIKNRRILGMLVFRYTCTPYLTRLGYIPPTFRFPTEEKHSRTPPRTRRNGRDRLSQESVRVDRRHRSRDDDCMGSINGV